ncbi:MAG: hypothetical protein AB7J35_20020 [Dehalococcoidia bacterium]
MSYTPDQLNNVIESGLAPRDPEIAGLARLANRLAYLAPAGPSSAASDRMALRFEAVMAGRHRRGWLALLGFAPAGGRPSLVQRLAAGTAVIGLLGGATSAATGVSPAEAARGTAHFVASAIANLTPNNDLSLAPDAGIAGPELGAPETTQGPAGETSPTPEPGSPAPGIAGTKPDGTASGTPRATTTPAGTATPTPPTPAGAGTARATASPAGSNPGTPVPGFSLPAAPSTPSEGGSAVPSQAPQDEPSHTPTPTATQQPTSTPTPSPTGTPSSAATPPPAGTPTPSPYPSGHHDDGEDDHEHETPEPTETPESEDDH